MARRRGSSFHEALDNGCQEDNVQFITPYYDEQGPEPLDLSKLNLDLDCNGNDEEYDDEEVDEDEIYNRGRSRSRSVHEYDADAAQFIPNEVAGEIQPSNTAEGVIKLNHTIHQNSSVATANTPPVPPGVGGKGERSGPLQHREVVALQKGLEEATQQIANKFHSREDEEERMAADAEKRKRMFVAANNPANSSEPARRIKLLLLGDSGVGKSSLIMRWTLDAFSPSLVSTVGVNFKSKKIQHNGEFIQVQVWDTAGQEQFHKITTSYYKGAQGIMLVYDVSDLKSLENVEYWIKNIKSHASDSVQVVLVGNKIDLRSTDPQKKCVDTERGKEIAMKFGVPFFEASAKDSSHVDEAFLTLVGHIADLTSPTKIILSRTSLQGGLDRKTLNIPEVSKEKEKEKDNKEKPKIFSSLLKEKKSPPAGSTSSSDGSNHKSGVNPDEKCIIA